MRGLGNDWGFFWIATYGEPRPERFWNLRRVQAPQSFDLDPGLTVVQIVLDSDSIVELVFIENEVAVLLDREDRSFPEADHVGHVVQQRRQSISCSVEVGLLSSQFRHIFRFRPASSRIAHEWLRR